MEAHGLHQAQNGEEVLCHLIALHVNILQPLLLLRELLGNLQASCIELMKLQCSDPLIVLWPHL